MGRAVVDGGDLAAAAGSRDSETGFGRGGVFTEAGANKLFKRHRATLRSLADVEQELNERFADMREAILCLLLAAASGEPMLLVGPPGTAKSRLVRAYCNIVGLIDDDEMEDATRAGAEERVIPPREHYFEYLLTQFTEPSELFGYFDLEKLHNDNQLTRLDTGMMQHAKVVFLDEVFNASSAILNSLLTFMNERKFHDRGQTIRVPLQCLFGATNSVPTSDELRAIYDRFLLRCWLTNEPSEPARLGHLLDVGWRETHAPPKHTPSGRKRGKYDRRHHGLLSNLAELRDDIEALSRKGELAIDASHQSFGRLASLIANVRKAGLSDVSNRRLIKMAKVMLIHRLYVAATADGKPGDLAIERDDRLLLVRFGLDKPSDDFHQRIMQDTTGY